MSRAESRTADTLRLLQRSTQSTSPAWRSCHIDTEKLCGEIDRVLEFEHYTASAAQSATSGSPGHAHDAFWMSFKRELEKSHQLFGIQEKSCAAMIASIQADTARVKLEQSSAQAVVDPAFLSLAQQLEAAPFALTPFELPLVPASALTFHRLVNLCQLVSSLSRFIFVNYQILWRILSLYNQRTHRDVDQRTLMKLGSNPFIVTVKLSGLITKIDNLINKALQRNPSNHNNFHCPLCLMTINNPAVIVNCSSQHTFCFNCIARQPCFGDSCPACSTEVDCDSVKLKIGKLIEIVAMRGVQANAHAIDSKTSVIKIEDRAVTFSRPSRVKTERAGCSSHATISLPDSLAVPAQYKSPLSIRTPTSPLNSLLPTSPGPNASPTTSAAFAEFFAANVSSLGSGRIKRGQGVSCHQCKTNKDPDQLLFCGNRTEKGVRKRRCRKKYCEMCLRRSYPLNVLCQRSGGDWHCPACLGVCCCASCHRKEPNSGDTSSVSTAQMSPPSLNLSPHSAGTPKRSHADDSTVQQTSSHTDNSEQTNQSLLQRYLNPNAIAFSLDTFNATVTSPLSDLSSSPSSDEPLGYRPLHSWDNVGDSQNDIFQSFSSSSSNNSSTGAIRPSVLSSINGYPPLDYHDYNASSNAASMQPVSAYVNNNNNNNNLKVDARRQSFNSRSSSYRPPQQPLQQHSAPVTAVSDARRLPPRVETDFNGIFGSRRQSFIGSFGSVASPSLPGLSSKSSTMSSSQLGQFTPLHSPGLFDSGLPALPSLGASPTINPSYHSYSNYENFGLGSGLDSLPLSSSLMSSIELTESSGLDSKRETSDAWTTQALDQLFA